MPAYVIVEIRLTDPNATQEFQEYAEKTTQLLADAGISVKVFDQAPTILEGDWAPAALVVQEYPDLESVHKFYNSKEYEPLRKLRAKFSNNNVIVVNGL